MQVRMLEIRIKMEDKRSKLGSIGMLRMMDEIEMIRVQRASIITRHAELFQNQHHGNAGNGGGIPPAGGGGAGN